MVKGLPSDLVIGNLCHQCTSKRRVWTATAASDEAEHNVLQCKISCQGLGTQWVHSMLRDAWLQQHSRPQSTELAA